MLQIPVDARTDELDQTLITEELKLLPDLRPNVTIVAVPLRKFIFEFVDFSERSQSA